MQRAGYATRPIDEFIQFLLQNQIKPIEGATPEEIWGQYFSVISPITTELITALLKQGIQVRYEFDAAKGCLSITPCNSK
jgi:hypothetical protein